MSNEVARNASVILKERSCGEPDSKGNVKRRASETASLLSKNGYGERYIYMIEDDDDYDDE